MLKKIPIKHGLKVLCCEQWKKANSTSSIVKSKVITWKYRSWRVDKNGIKPRMEEQTNDRFQEGTTKRAWKPNCFIFTPLNTVTIINNIISSNQSLFYSQTNQKIQKWGLLQTKIKADMKCINWWRWISQCICSINSCTLEWGV